MLEYKVFGFSYNGFAVRVHPSLANFTAEFLRWTEDPGIAVCSCSDGEIRNIPTCALKNFNADHHPTQIYPKADPLIYGVPSCSSKRYQVGMLCPLK